MTLTFLSSYPTPHDAESTLKFLKWKKITSLKTKEGAGDEKYEMATIYLTVSFELQLNGLKVKPYGRENLMTSMYDSLTTVQAKVKVLRNKQNMNN